MDFKNRCQRWTSKNVRKNAVQNTRHETTQCDYENAVLRHFAWCIARLEAPEKIKLQKI